MRPAQTEAAARTARIPAFGISFPFDEQVRRDHVVVVNKVWLRQDDDMDDSPEDEDDYDE